MSADVPIGTDDTEFPPPPPASGARRAVARAAAVVSSATLASRILGFLRDLVIARAFGAGVATDAFFVAFRLPNLLRRLVAEGALSSAFIPVFTEYVTTRSRARHAPHAACRDGVMLLLLGALTLLGVLAAPWFVRRHGARLLRQPGRGRADRAADAPHVPVPVPRGTVGPGHGRPQRSPPLPPAGAVAGGAERRDHHRRRSCSRPGCRSRSPGSRWACSSAASASSCCRFHGSGVAACSRPRRSRSATLRSGGSWG